MKLTSQGKTDILELKDGAALFLNAQSQVAENVGQSRIKLLVVELKK